MPHADFVHLRVHSAFSLSEGAILIPDLIALCERHAMPAIAVTDSGNLFGAMQFSEAAFKAGVQPIIGCLLPLAAEDGQGEPDGLPVLAQNETGYSNLVKLVSRAFLDSEPGETPHVSWDDLQSHGEGLIALTGGVGGPVGRLLASGQTPAAEAVLARLQALFSDRLYIELTRHGLDEEKRIEPALLHMAYERNLPLVATNDVYFADVAMHEAHEALLCIAQGVTLNNEQRRRVNAEHYFKSPAEMRALFADLPEAIDNSLVIARRCAARAPAHAPILPVFPELDGVSEADELRNQAAAGLEIRLDDHVYTPGMSGAEREATATTYRERLDFELGVINKMEYPGYFLIVAEFIRWAKEHDIPVGPGRGSGAGSVVAWALTITDLDPLRFGLLFERFLNPERISMPDFDIDFCEDRRDEVIAHVQEEYGRDQVAQIITFGTLRARAALRDVGRVLEMPYGQVDRICKMIPNNPADPVTLDQAIRSEAPIRAARDEDESVARLLALALKLEGLYRHASTHAAGVVIGDRPLAELVPLYRDPRSEMPVTQFSMKDVERAGLVKFDFLGLKTLTVLDRTQRLLAKRGVEIDVAHLPLDNEATYAMLGRGETVGVFQLESSGMRDVLTKLKPDAFEVIIALVALYRPGPMDNIPKFIACKQGREPADYLHPMLEDTLKETFGVIVYQEQVMEIARVLSGFTLGQADILRRAMGKKDKAEMAAQRKAFIAGAMKNEVPEWQAGSIFDLVDKFAGYGFNKSHAAAYALIAYQTAYFKANYPVEFFAASMSLELGNTDKLNVFRKELTDTGITLLQPDVNHSGAGFLVDQDEAGKAAIRYALAAIKNVGEQAMQALVDERDAKGPFKDLFDFAGRLDPRVINKRQIENLARAGAFDCLEPNRAKVHAAAELLTRHAHAMAEERASNQVSLFGGGDEDGNATALAPPDLPNITQWTKHERGQQAFDAVGFYLYEHPLEAFESELKRLKVTPIAEINELVSRDNPPMLTLAGIMAGKQERRGARGRFAFITLSDPSGDIEVALFSEILETSRELLDTGAPLLIKASAQPDGDQLRVNAMSVQSLNEAIAKTACDLEVHMAEAPALASLHDILARAGAGRGRVTLVIDLDDREVEVAIPGRFGVTPRLRAEIEEFPGVTRVSQR
jgi:DNA polymerase-3 subunit alpha